MSYPNSTAVTVGQATEAAQYNNLRKDALCLGADPDSSGTLRDLLYMSVGQISLNQVGTNGIQLVASEDAPTAVMINGQIYYATSNLSYSMSESVFPDPGYYVIYANALSSGKFSLGVGASVPGNARKIGGLVWSGSYIIRGTVRNEIMEAVYLAKNPFVCNGRLTLASSTPIPEDDISNGEDLYFTPYQGNEISLYLGGQWIVFSFSELSLNLSGLQREMPYDIFLAADSSGLCLDAQVWGSVSARAVALVRQNGILVSTADSGKRYLGTICVNSSGYGEDTKSGRLVWNEYNRVARPVLAKLVTATTSGRAHMGVWAPYYDDEAPYVRLVIPKADCELSLDGVGLGSEISESDRAYGRASALSILQDPMLVSPYTLNAPIVPAFTHNSGNSPLTCRLTNYGGSMIGFHRYYLGFWSNYSFYPIGTNIPASGEAPGISGYIMG